MGSDDTFLKSLSKYIYLEKEHLPTSEKVASEQRFVIYSSAFDKVIAYRLYNLSSLIVLGNCSKLLTLLITVNRTCDRVQEDPNGN